MKYLLFFTVPFIFSCTSHSGKDSTVGAADSSSLQTKQITAVPPGWISFQPEKDGYKISLPGNPEQRIQPFSTKAGELKMTLWEYKMAPGIKDVNDRYLFGYTDYPYNSMKTATANDVDDMLDEAIKNFSKTLTGDSIAYLVNNYDTMLIADPTVDKRYYLASQVTAKFENDSSKVWVMQYFFVKNRLYLLGVVIPKDKRDNTNEQSFFTSFALPSGKTLSEIMADTQYGLFLSSETYSMRGRNSNNNLTLFDFRFGMSPEEFSERSKSLEADSTFRYDEKEQHYFYFVSSGRHAMPKVKCTIIPAFNNNQLYQLKLLAKDDGTNAQNRDSSFVVLLMYLVKQNGIPGIRYTMPKDGDLYSWFNLYTKGNYGSPEFADNQGVYLYKNSEGTIATCTDLSKLVYIERDSIRPGTGKPL